MVSRYASNKNFTEYDYDAIVKNIPELTEGETKDIYRQGRELLAEKT